MRYQVNVSVMISEDADATGNRFSSSTLSYYKQYTITGDSFSDIAPSIDRVHEAIEAASDAQPEPPFSEDHHRYHTPAGPNPKCPNCKWLNWMQP